MNPGNRCAIFVHGGAGYHSKEAEADHLRACRSASILAMAVLKSGGTAVDAVEAAIKNLEDNELTNAGYGSNLTLTGNVECDATIIDHLGRSGSVGAVSNIKNPISLARVILDNSMRPRPIGLLPPNFLAGPGAAEYAYEHGFPILPNDFLVSPASKRSYEKHMNELQEEQKKRKEAEKEEEMNGFKYPLSPKNYSRWAGVSQSTFDAHQCTPQMPGAFSQSPTYMNGYLQPMEQTYGEPLHNQPSDYRFFIDGGGPPACGDGTKSVKVCASHHHCEMDNSKSARPNTTAHGCPDAMHKVDKTQDIQPATNLSEANLSFFNSNSDQGCIDDSFHWPLNLDGTADHTCSCPKDTTSIKKPSHKDITPNSDSNSSLRPDDISDTVGAIAIDMHGNIAAGSSSGGLLLKNPGRIGPAALVNVGTSVLPVDPDDEDQRCVAVAVSGTGERMLTTTLARRCAERTYDCVRKVKLQGGKETVLEECTEDEALASVINNEFMGHPGVAHSGFGSAIGVMGVKMERRGIAFFFGHTAESFAVASMHADDIEPQVLVSRINKNEKGKKKDQISVLQGGRLYPFRKKRTKAAEGASPSHTRSTRANQSAAEGNMKAKG